LIVASVLTTVFATKAVVVAAVADFFPLL
jgi:hypothetical protein